MMFGSPAQRRHRLREIAEQFARREKTHRDVDPRRKSAASRREDVASFRDDRAHLGRFAPGCAPLMPNA